MFRSGAFTTAAPASCQAGTDIAKSRGEVSTGIFGVTAELGVKTSLYRISLGLALNLSQACDQTAYLVFSFSCRQLVLIQSSTFVAT
jgi:hypothetical protein